MLEKPMIQVCHLSKRFQLGNAKVLTAVNDVSLTIEKGEVLGLVGESGSGKSTLGKMLLRLIPASSGQIFFEGEDITHKKSKILYRKMQMIFQDPYSSLNPSLSVENILAEPTRIHSQPDRVDELLDLVGLPTSAKKRYPHEFSGGQRQRIGIARSLALNPNFLVCDEPISSLDISIQAQIVNLLIKLKNELKLTLLFIAHDLSMVRYVSDRVAVMKEGVIVEINQTESLYTNPLHPYTKLLLSSIPILDLGKQPPQSSNPKLHNIETSDRENAQVLL
jgi:ABC-type oligopeptide transport system ATPase subunit